MVLKQEACIARDGNGKTSTLQRIGIQLLP